MFAGNSTIEPEERKACEAYIKKHDIDGLIQELVEGLLRERPRVQPKEYFRSHLRLSLAYSEEESDAIDEEVRRAAEESDAIDEEVRRAAEVPGDMLRKLFEATKVISSEIHPKETIHKILEETSKLLQCDRIHLFVFDARINMLVLNSIHLEHPVRVMPGQGITGHVFNTMELVNIQDCQQDPRFDSSVDMVEGCTAQTLLAMPIIDFDQEVIGVLQAVNKLEAVNTMEDEEDGYHHTEGPGFSIVDEIMMENLAEQASIALRNAEVYRAAIVTSERANALLHMLSSLREDLGVQSLVLSVATHANQLVRADRCTVFLVDDQRGQLWSIATDSGTEVRIPKQGIAGECAQENKLIAIDDAYNDARFNPEVDRKTGYRTKSIIAVPVKQPPDFGRACAVIQMINKMEFDGEIGKFDEEDIQVLETFATFVAEKLGKSAFLMQAAQALPSTSSASPRQRYFRQSSFGDRRPSTKVPMREAVISEEPEEIT